MDILVKALPYLISLVSGSILVVCTYKINRALKARDAALEKETEKQDAIANGVLSLLRRSILDDFNKYSAKGCVPPYARENLERTYAAYHALGGNDMATDLYTKLRALPVKED